MKVTWGSRDMIDSAFEMISVLSPSKGCESGHDHRQNFFGELVVLGVGFEERIYFLLKMKREQGKQSIG